jgi:MFS transporter, OFA family, oxalate/formate antiporter
MSFLLLGSVASLTQVLSIVFRTAAYPNPIDKTSWTPGQLAFYSSLFMVWLSFLVIWKPLLGLLNDKIGLVGMMLISMTLMALAIVYLPSMVYGSSVAVMYVAMIFLAAGISNALVTPPLVITQAMGVRDFAKIFSLAVAFIYAGNAIGAPIWGVLGTSGNTKIGMYVAPVLLALFVIGCTTAVRRGKAQYTKLARVSWLSQCPDSRSHGPSERLQGWTDAHPCSNSDRIALTSQGFGSRHVGDPLDRHSHAAGPGNHT